jgi:hypothetical protein
MAIKFNRSQTFATNGTVTAAGLHNLVDGLDVYQALITDQTSLAAVATDDSILIADASLTSGDAPRQTTVLNLFDDALTGGTYTNANFTGNITYGTGTGNRTVSTTSIITTGTISNLTAGTTASTAASITNGTITNGTITIALIPTLTSGTTTATAENVTTGTIATLNSTTGTIVNLRSTTGTIANLSTTLAGDLTISQGTATLATTGATAGSYGSVSAIPFITIDAKGRVTSATTGTFSSTPADGSITYAKLSTSSTESDNAAKRTAKAWVNFDGQNAFSPNPSTSAIRSSFNVSSITDGGTGIFTVNFTSALSDANYAVVATHSFANLSITRISSVAENTASQSKLTVTQTDSNLCDPNILCAVFFR